MRLLEPTTLGSFTATPLGLGTARHGAFWQGKSVSDGVSSVRAALDLGVSLIDTADVYARGLSERIVGRAVGGRQGVVVMTKVGLLKTPIGMMRAARSTGGVPDLRGARAATAAGTCFEADYVLASAHACIRRQRREALDVLLLHEPDAEDLRAERFMPAVERLMGAGDVIDFGVSVRDSDAALAALDNPVMRWLQIPVNANHVEIADAVSRHPRSQEVTVVAIGVLGDGHLLSSDGSAASSSLPDLVHAAYRQPAVDAVLLGMSSPQRVVANLAALRRREMLEERVER